MSSSSDFLFVSWYVSWYMYHWYSPTLAVASRNCRNFLFRMVHFQPYSETKIVVCSVLDNLYNINIISVSWEYIKSTTLDQKLITMPCVSEKLGVLYPHSKNGGYHVPLRTARCPHILRLWQTDRPRYGEMCRISRRNRLRGKTRFRLKCKNAVICIL